MGNKILLRPKCVAIDLNGDYIVSDSGNNRLQFFNPRGTPTRIIETRHVYGDAGTTVLDPTGVAVDGDGNIICADYGQSQIRVFSPSGEQIRVFGEHGKEDGELAFPWGITVDGQNNIIVADRSNSRVQIFSSEGTEPPFLFPLVKSSPTLSLWSRVSPFPFRCHYLFFLLTACLGKFLMNFGRAGGDQEEYLTSPMTPVLDRMGNIFVTDSTSSLYKIFG